MQAAVRTIGLELGLLLVWATPRLAQAQACAGASSDFEREQCYTQLALNTADPAYCGYIQGSNARRQCYTAVAGASGNTSCNSIESGLERHYCQLEGRQGQVRQEEQQQAEAQAAEQRQLQQQQVQDQQQQLQAQQQQIVEQRQLLLQLEDYLGRQQALLEQQLQEQRRVRELLDRRLQAEPGQPSSSPPGTPTESEPKGTAGSSATPTPAPGQPSAP